MAQLISEKPFAKSTYAKYCQMVRDGTVKQGDPDYDITLAKIKDYAAWQESTGVKVRKTANTTAIPQRYHSDTTAIPQRYHNTTFRIKGLNLSHM